MVEASKIKNLIKEKNFEKCVEILRKDIINKLVEDIQKVRKNFVYTDIYDLNRACNLYLDGNKKHIVKHIVSFSNETIDIVDEIEILLYAYKIVYEI